MAKKKSKKQDWEIIDTPYGQWEYPGAITRIPSNDIQMMYPNQDYQFDGSSVTEYPLPEAGSGYKVVRSSERKGKTHKVTGPDGTVKFFGDSKLGQHPKDPARKKAFYARHKKNLDGNPYFRAFARKTWEEGGELNDWEILDTAQDGKYLKDDDSTLENLVEFVDPTGLSSWDDVYRSYQNTGLSPQTGLEVLGALPLLGKIGKSGKVIAGGTDLLHTLAPIMKNPKAQKALYDTYRTYKNVGGDKLDKALGYTTQLLVDNTKLFNPTYRASSDAAINTINKIEKAARLSKAKDFIPTSEYKPYSDYQQPIVPIDNTRVATPVIPIKTERPYTQKAPLPGQSVPTMDFAQGGKIKVKSQDWEILEDDLPVAKLGTNLEDNKAAYKTVQSKINEGFAKERKYREDVLKYANSVKDDKAFGQRVHDFIANKCRGTSSRINDCIGEATTYLKDAGYLDKVYTSNSNFQDDIKSGKIKNFKLVAGNSTNANTVKPGDVVQTTHSIQDPNNPERRFSGQPKHAMFVNKAQPDSTGNLSEFSYIGNWGDASVSHGEHDRTSMMNSFGAGDFQIIKPNFVDQSLVRTRDSLTKEIQKEEPLFNKSPKLIRYNDMRPVKLTPANPGSYSALQLAQLKDTQKMYQPVIDNQAELMKKYNLTQKEFVGLLDNMIGVGEAESQQGSLMSPRYLAKQIPGMQFLAKHINGEGIKVFDPGEYSTGPWQTKGKYVPKTSYERGSALEAFATMADRYKNQVSNTLKGTDAGFNEAVNKYKGLKDTQNEYLKRVRDVDTFNIEVDGQTQELPKYIGRKQPIRNQPQQIMPEFKNGGMLPDLAAMAFGGNLILEKYQDGGSNWEILPEAGDGTSLIDLHLPKYPDRRTQNLYATPYMFGLSPAKDVNVYGAGASFGVNFLDRGRNTFGATGNVNNTAVSYPGGFEISSDPYRSLGLRYVHRFQKGGTIPKAQTGTQPGYSWSTQQIPTQQVVGSAENPQASKLASKPVIQPFQKGYVNPKIMTSQTGEEGLGDDIGGMMVMTALAPGSLPFRASSRLGRVALAAGELANPVSGFRGIKPKFALQNADPIITNQTKGFNVEYDGLLDFQKKAGFEPYKFDNKNWYDVPDESEINWRAWNEEIPNNKALMQEYKTIEQSSKSNGTWMKNPDGSPFKGTPEQFVQQNSINFKKAFPNVLRDEAGNIQKTYHGSQNTFDYFDPSIMMTGRTRGQGIYTSPFRERAASYATKGDKKVYEFYQNANKSQDIVEQFNKESKKRFKDFLEKNPKGSKDFDKKFNEFMKRENELDNLTDEDFNLQQGYDFLKTSPDEYVVPFTNYPKSAIGNNGMFDMTNPNIYKGLAPIGIGAGIAATQPKNEPYRNGGKIKPKSSDWEIVSDNEWEII